MEVEFQSVFIQGHSLSAICFSIWDELIKMFAVFYSAMVELPMMEQLCIYFAASETWMREATSTIDKLLDYSMNSPEEGYRSATSMERIKILVSKNNSFLDKKHVFLESI